MLPMLDGFERHNSFVGGASLWTLKGKSAEEYKGAAAFYNFIATPEQTQWWSTVTGRSVESRSVKHGMPR